jgi:hypothetical protein
MSVHFATYLHFPSRESCSVIKPHGLNQPNLFPDGAGFHLMRWSAADLQKL